MTQVPERIQKRVADKVSECMAKASEYYNRHFPMPRITYEVRGGVAGYAYQDDNRVDFNAVLLIENEDDFIERTVPHECAHIIDFAVNPQNHKRQWVRNPRTGHYRLSKRNVHGKDFKFIMERVLGAKDSSRCHSYDTTNARVRKRTNHVWVCNDCGAKMVLGPKRHNNMMTGVREYRRYGCSRHRGGYTYVGIEGQEPRAVEPAKTLAKAANTASHNHPTAKGSKIAKCRELFDPNASRADNIAKFISDAGCTKAGASTYYAKIKSERAVEA